MTDQNELTKTDSNESTTLSVGSKKRDALIGTVIAARYELISLLGRGATTSVYKAEDKEKKKFDFAAMMRALFHMPAGSIVLLQGCCHNPTGCDPTLEEWKAIAEACKKHSLLPFFDVCRALTQD